MRHLSCFGSAGENRGKFHRFFEEQISELPPKNVAKTAKIQLDEWQLLLKEYILD